VSTPIVLQGVTEYAEGDSVELDELDNGRLVIKAYNSEGGRDCTEVDLIELLHWIKLNRPDLLGEYYVDFKSCDEDAVSGSLSGTVCGSHAARSLAVRGVYQVTAEQ